MTLIKKIYKMLLHPIYSSGSSTSFTKDLTSSRFPDEHA